MDGATSGAEGDSDGGGELLDAGLEGGSGALVEGDILGRGAHHSPWATAPGSGKPRPAAGLPGRGGGRDSSTYVEGGGGAEEGGIHGQSCVGLAWVLEEAAAADESWMEEEE
jgi:hypothetical protein